MMERIDIRSPGGVVLIGPPSSIPVGFRARLDQHAAVRAIFSDPHAVERLRWLWPKLGLGGTSRNVSDHDLRVTADHAVTSGRLVAVLAPKHLPQFNPADGVAKPAAPKLVAGGQAHASGATPEVPEEAGDRIVEALKRSRRHVGPELVKMIDQMLVPTLVIGLITFLIGLVALQFTGPVAAAIDGALIVIAYACAGLAGIQAAYQFVEATRLAIAAKTSAQLEEAGKLYADALLVLGTVFLAWLLRRIEVKRGGGVKPVERTAAPPAEPVKPVEPSAAQVRGPIRPKQPGVIEKLTDGQIAAHLKPFEEGVAKIVSKETLEKYGGVVGPPAGTFVFPKSYVEECLRLANGDVRKLESLLSLEKGVLGDNPMLIEAVPKGLRMATGAEAGANADFITGGFTKGGVAEAVVDQMKPGSYIAKAAFPGH